MAETLGTLATLVGRIRRMLEDAPTIDTLAGSATSGAATVTVTTPASYTQGNVFEVADELFLVTGAPTGSSLPVVRGYRDTTAAAHSAGDTVRIGPRFSATNIKEAINVVLGNWISFYCPQLVWDSTTAGSFTSTRDAYAVPTDATGVARVCFKPSGISGLDDVAHGPLETFPTTIVSTGKGFTIRDEAPAGYAVYLLYERPWPYLAVDSDAVASDFPLVMDNLITDGAVLYLLGWRLAPKFKLDETVFSREAGTALPANFSMQSMEVMRRNWIQGVHRMQYMRAGPRRPRKVFVD